MRYLIITLFLLPNLAFACFCIAPTELTDATLKGNDIVFKGTVINIAVEDAYYRVTFQVKETIKGKKTGKLTIEFDSISSCAVRRKYKLGEHYLISAIKREAAGSSQGKIRESYHSNLCSLQIKLKKI